MEKESLETTSEIDVNAEQEVFSEVDASEIDTNDAGALSFDDLDEIVGDSRTSEVINDKEAEAIQEDKSAIEGESSSEESETDEEEAAKEEYKKLMARYGEEELEIAANAIFKHKVDGEEVDVELQELLNNYSGKVSYDKKFQEFSTSKKDFETYKDQYDKDIEAITGYVSTFREKMNSEDPMEALNYFAEFSGMKPHEFRRQLVNAMIPEVNRLSGMSADQYQAEYLKQENEYLQKKQESENVKYSEQQSLKELEREIQQIQEAHNISEEDFSKAYHELADADFEGEITPQVVADYHNHSVAFSKAEDILSQVNSSLVQNNEIVERLQNVIVENPVFDDNDLIEIVQEVYGNVQKESSEKVSRKVAPKQQSRQPAKKVSQELQDIIDWDDL